MSDPIWSRVQIDEANIVLENQTSGIVIHAAKGFSNIYMQQEQS